jgi:hypothetical protein
VAAVALMAVVAVLVVYSTSQTKLYLVHTL